MIFGALHALVEKRFRRFLAYSSINQMGFLLMGITAGSVETTKAAMIFLIIYVITNLGLFIIVLNTSNHESGEFHNSRPLLYLTDFNHFAKNNKFHSIAIAIIFFSMAGIPPLAGFFGKYFLFLTVFEQEHYSLVVIGLFTSVISTFYYLKIIKSLWFANLKVAINFNTTLTQYLTAILIITQLILVTYIFTINNWLYACIDGILDFNFNEAFLSIDLTSTIE